MSKFEQQLKPCPYCGGKAEYKSVKTKKRITAGTLQERYIRCSKCHTRTQAYGKIDNVVNAWNSGRVYVSNVPTGYRGDEIPPHTSHSF